MFPHLVTVLVEHVVVEGGVLRITASTKDGTAAVCPGCGSASTRVHSRYGRRIADAPVGTRPVLIELSVRRLFCDNGGCARVTFAEQVDGLTSRYGRRTPILQRAIGALGVVLAARAVVRLGLLLGIMVSRMTVLRVVMALPEPAWAVPRVLGVDEFATRKGRRYGSILIDCETRQPLDLLPDREAATLASWLREHPGIEIVCRDRAAFFADGARTGAPQAQHCADKWHVWHNLGEAVERLVSRHRALLRELVEPAPVPEAGPAPEPAPTTADDKPPEPYPPGKFLDRLRDTHAAVRAQVEQGLSLREVARRLGLGRNTVRKYARAATPEAMLHGQWQDRTSKLDPYRPYLEQRIAEGCTNLSQLHRELQERGARCSYSTLRDYVHPLRPGRQPASGATADGPAALTPRSHPLDHEPPRPPARGRPIAAQDAAGPLARAHGRHRPRPDVRDHHEQPRRRPAARVDRQRLRRRAVRPDLLRRRTDPRPRRSHLRAEHGVELRPGRGQSQ